MYLTFNPDVDRKPYWDDFPLEVEADTTILDALEILTRLLHPELFEDGS